MPPYLALSPALYADGGGVDGTGMLQRIMNDIFDRLSEEDKGDGRQALMTTEVPNAEDSCCMPRDFLPPGLRDDVKIRVAYVESDAENAEEYARERERDGGGWR